MTSFLPLYLKEQVGLPSGTVVILDTVVMVGGALSSILWGWAADRIGSRPVLMSALAIGLVIAGRLAAAAAPHSECSVVVRVALYFSVRGDRQRLGHRSRAAAVQWGYPTRKEHRATIDISFWAMSGCSWVLTLIGIAYSLYQRIRADIFQQITLRPGPNGWKNFVILSETGQNDDPRRRADRFYPGCCLDAIHLRHDQVQQNNIGGQPAVSARLPRLRSCPSPTTSISSCRSMNMRSPWRTTAWSSTISTRIFGGRTAGASAP
jgi:hypothetical protein